MTEQDPPTLADSVARLALGLFTVRPDRWLSLDFADEAG